MLFKTRDQVISTAGALVTGVCLASLATGVRMVALKDGIVLAGQVGDRRGDMRGRLVLSEVLAWKYISDVIAWYYGV